MSISDAELAAALTEAVLDGGAINADSSLVPEAGAGSVPMLAFTVWLHEAGRDVQRTAEIVTVKAGVEVTAEMVRGWREAGEWGRIAGRVNQALSESAVEVTNGTLRFATIKAATTLLEIVCDPEVSPTSRIKAAVSILDRGGFPALIRGELFSGITVGGDMDTLTDDELRAQWESYDPNAPVQVAHERDQRHGDTARIDYIAERQATAAGNHSSYQAH